MKQRQGDNIYCHEDGVCFAKMYSPVNGRVICKCLSNTVFPSNKHCPFQKPYAEVTDGVTYPFNQYYGVKTDENNTTKSSTLR